jgi:hypothetical protein
MKTTLQILAALAIAFQGMVFGQTHGNQVERSKKIEVTHKKTYAVLGSSGANKNTTLNETSKNVTTHSGLSSEEALSAYNKSLQIPGNQKDVQILLMQAEEMQRIETEIRKRAESVSGSNKTKLLQNASQLAKQTELVLIQASEIKGKLNIETYHFNNEIYSDLISDPNVNDNFAQYSESLKQEADKYIRLAKEMRQEAYAMPSNSAKLGTMVNAEDKETQALLKQNEAINNLNKLSVPVMAVK